MVEYTGCDVDVLDDLKRIETLMNEAARAARESGAWGLDVCSGVESAPGVKGTHLLDRLFQEVRHHGAIPSPA